MRCVCAVLYCVEGVYCICAEHMHALGEDGAGAGVYFLHALFSPHITVCLEYLWKEGTQRFFASSGLTSQLPLYTNYIHEAIRVSGLQSFIISVRISIPPA